MAVHQPQARHIHYHSRDIGALDVVQDILSQLFGEAVVDLSLKRNQEQLPDLDNRDPRRLAHHSRFLAANVTIILTPSRHSTDLDGDLHLDDSSPTVRAYVEAIGETLRA